MTAKQYLNEYKGLNKEIESLRQERERLRAQAENTGSLRLGVIGHANKVDPDAGFTNVVHKIIEIEALIDKKIARLVQKQEEIESCIDSVNDPQLRTLLRHRYINGYTFEKIAVELNYSYRNTHYMHCLALKKVYEMNPTLHSIAHSKGVK